MGRAGLVLSLAALAGCSTIESVGNRVGGVFGGSSPEVGQVGAVRGFLGNVAAEEPRAAQVARDVLSAGGSAADAAVAAGFALSVTLPSRAGLGGGGACLSYDARKNTLESFLFQPGPRAGVPAGTDRPAAAPMMARGLFALHTSAGRLPFERTLQAAEQLARAGAPVSRALAADIAAVSGPLLADPASRAIFAPNGTPAAEGTPLPQPELAATLAAIRTTGVGDFAQGGLARRVEEASAVAGGGLTVAEMRAAVPQVGAPQQEAMGNETLAVLPAPADGGATLAAFRAAASGAAATPVPGLYGASTALVVQDRDGGAVACNFTLNNLFGTGRTLPGLGFLLAAAPGLGSVAAPPPGAILVVNTRARAMRYAGAGSGQGGAPAAAGVPAGLHLGRRVPLAQAVAAAPEPGRGVAVSCLSGVSASACTAAADPRGTGITAGGN